MQHQSAVDSLAQGLSMMTAQRLSAQDTACGHLCVRKTSLLLCLSKVSRLHTVQQMLSLQGVSFADKQYT